MREKLQAKIFMILLSASILLGMSGCLSQKSVSIEDIENAGYTVTEADNKSLCITDNGADYYFCNPKSVMTTTSVVYKNYDPISGETYYEGFKSNLAFHRIRLQYDAAYDVLKNGNYDFYVGGNFSCNAYLQFENYPSITGIISIGPASVFNAAEARSGGMFGGDVTALPIPALCMP